MRIVFAADVPDNRTGGMSKHLHSLSDALRDMGHTVDILWSGDVAPQVRSAQLRRFAFPIVLTRYLVAHASRYDIVCIHEPSGALYALLKRRWQRLPPLIAYTFGLERPDWERRYATLRAACPSTSIARLARSWLFPHTRLIQADVTLRHAAHVIVLSSHDERYLTDRYNISSRRVTRVDNGVAPHFLSVPSICDRQPSRILFVGSWIERKGCHVLATAFARAHACVPGLRLTLLGTGVPVERVLNDFPSNVRDDVEVIPSFKEPELLQSLARHTVFALPSLYEGMPLALLEAMAAGLAVISTTVGAMPDVVDDGVDGLLVPPSDATALAEAMIRCAMNPALCQDLGHRARTKMRAYTWQSAAQQHLRAFSRACTTASLVTSKELV